MKNFSIKESFQFGWETFKKNGKFLIRLFFVIWLPIIILSFAAEELQKGATPIAFLINAGILVWGIIISIGLVRISLRYVDNEKAVWSDLFSHVRLFWDFILGSLLYSIIIMCGLILFIVPGIIWAIQFSFFRYGIVDKDIGPLEALKRSSTITKGVRSHLLLFFVCVGITNLLGALAFGVGLFLTVPVTLFASAFVYRKLLSQTTTRLET